MCHEKQGDGRKKEGEKAGEWSCSQRGHRKPNGQTSLPMGGMPAGEEGWQARRELLCSLVYKYLFVDERFCFPPAITRTCLEPSQAWFCTFETFSLYSCCWILLFPTQTVPMPCPGRSTYALERQCFCPAEARHWACGMERTALRASCLYHPRTSLHWAWLLPAGCIRPAADFAAERERS